MLKLFAERDARIYLVGQTVSLIGDRMLWLAMGIWIKSLTGSSGAAGLTFFFFAFPSLFAPLAGALVDRLPRRPVLIVANLATAAVVACLLLVDSRSGVWLIYLVMFLYGASYLVLGAGGSVLLRMLFPSELLPEANGYLSTVREGSQLFAPLAGAGLFTVVGGGALACIDSAAFLVAALSLLAIKVPEAPALIGEQAPWRQYTTAGLRYLAANIPLRQITIAVGITLLVVGACESIEFAVVSQGLDHRPPFLGILTSVQGAGALAGAFTAARLMRRIGPGLIIGIGLGLVAIGCAGWIASTELLVLPASAAIGLAVSWIIVGFNTAIQRLTPLALQGRVDSAGNLLIGTPQTISIALGAGLITWIDYRLLLVIIAAVVALAAAYLTTRRQQQPTALVASASAIEPWST